MAPDQVARYRTAVDDDRRGEDLQAAGRRRRRASPIAGESLKTRPRGFDADHPRIELLRHKGAVRLAAWPPDDVLHEAGAPRRVVATWRALRPLAEWLDDHVGPSEQPRR